MMGYLHEPQKTGKVFDSEGWLHSGDIGTFKENCLFITGRIKELLVTAGGENIAPAPVEFYIKKECPALSQAVMVGDKMKYCSLLVSVATEIDSKGDPTDRLQPLA
ncbi:MAG: AMP-binding protein, partial [bacterium]|nr:AMP-binding protein [bacterium]